MPTNWRWHELLLAGRDVRAIEVALPKGRSDSFTPASTDGVYHAVVGKHFGASFSHETSNYIHLKCDLHNVIIFKSKDSPFDLDAANV